MGHSSVFHVSRWLRTTEKQLPIASLEGSRIPLTKRCNIPGPTALHSRRSWMCETRLRMASYPVPACFVLIRSFVFEVGVFEYYSGKTIIDTAVQGNIKKLSEIPTSTIRDGVSKRFKQEMSWKTIRRDYGGYTQAITVGPMSTLRRHSYENPRSPRDHSSWYGINVQWVYSCFATY